MNFLCTTKFKQFNSTAKWVIKIATKTRRLKENKFKYLIKPSLASSWQ
jgi:hypothetical protein